MAFFRVYQGTNRNDPLAPVQLRTTVIDAHDRVVAGESAALDAAAFANERTADHYVTLPLAGLRPGEYLLKVDTTMGTRTAGRTLRFVVS